MYGRYLSVNTMNFFERLEDVKVIWQWKLLKCSEFLFRSQYILPYVQF